MKDDLKKFSYSQDEQKLIDKALLQEKPWQVDETKPIRDKIHAFHHKLTDELCCYCQANQHGEFKLDIDPEHILPASKYKHYSFTIWNLSVACKRCNMLIKRSRTDFINKKFLQEDSSNHYKFIHPNFDDFEKHMEITVQQKGRKRIVKYLVYSKDKGQYTFEYFRLAELEINNFNKAQGIKTAPLDSNAVEEVKELAFNKNI